MLIDQPHAPRRTPKANLITQILTASIVLGWSLLVTVLGLWTDMGVGQGIIGGTSYPIICRLLCRELIFGVCVASGLYALTFGLLGLIPAPKIRRS